MRQFKSRCQAQRFLSSFELIRGHFHPKQHQLTAEEYHHEMYQKFESWRELAGIMQALHASESKPSSKGNGVLHLFFKTDLS